MEAAFRAAVAACDPEALVAKLEPMWGWGDGVGPSGPRVFGLAIGKAALAMARGVGAVRGGLAIAPADDGRGLPAGWRLMLGSHPEPDARSVAAGAAAIELVEAAAPNDVVLALISGGASSLCEQPLVPLDEFRARIAALVAAGAPIAEVNALRTSLSAIKGGKLAARCRGHLFTLIASDVIGDDPRVIGSGPTVGPTGDRVFVIAPMRLFAHRMAAALGVRVLDPPMQGDVADVAARLAAEPPPFVAWGEPTIALPPHPGRGGRAQQLALLLARAIAGTPRTALVAASDGSMARRRPRPARTSTARRGRR